MAKKTISLPIEEDLLQKIQDLSIKNGRSRTGEIVFALSNYANGNIDTTKNNDDIKPKATDDSVKIKTGSLL